MTCQEFRRINAAPELVLEATRAERAASVRHYFECASCTVWFEEQPYDRDAVRRLNAQCDVDVQDPEYRETTGRFT